MCTPRGVRITHITPHNAHTSVYTHFPDRQASLELLEVIQKSNAGYFNLTG